MALADPQSITIAGSANSLQRTGAGQDQGTFRKDDSSIELLASHKMGNRVRHTVRLNHNKVAVDPLVPTVNRPYSMSCIVTVDVPNNQGYTLAEQKDVITGFLSWFTASTGANLTKILGGES